MIRETKLLFERRGAEFSGCGRYRYRLWRYWEGEAKVATFIMLNPSIADESINDPTVERCYRRARLWQCSGMRVVNLFALISTDPMELQRFFEQGGDPVGPHNDRAIIESVSGSLYTVAGWGKDGRLLQREKLVKSLLWSNFGQSPLTCLGKNIDGTPRHPLYVPYSQKLITL